MSLSALYEVPAPAKINLFLHIVGRRSDGYHLLESFFALVDWSDTLHFECRSDGHIARHDLGLPLPELDLSLRAARALQVASACKLGADISIDKRVPWGAGMGGGSSDAASTLLALNRLWGLNWPRQKLAEIGLQLGADVPFFIGGDNAFVQGVGEVLSPITLKAATYAIVKPPAAITTQDIFRDPDLKRDTKALHDAAILLGSLESGGLPGCNDLQAVACKRCPDVMLALQWLHERYGNSRMTGSGSAVFSRVAENEVAVHVPGINALPQATFPTGELPAGWVGRRCRGLQQHPLKGWAD